MESDGYWDEEKPVKRESVKERKARCETEIARRAEAGDPLQPILIEGRDLAKSFWGKAWLKNVESYADYEHWLSPGRSYLRNSSLIHFEEQNGGKDGIFAFVMGREEYEVTVQIDAADSDHWADLKEKCAGQIHSIVDLLSGKMPDAVMEAVSDPEGGLFPKVDELHLRCNCAEYADLCAHGAAVLYGIGHRLDDDPALLFRLRSLDPSELLEEVSTSIHQMTTEEEPSALDDKAISDIFGIELED